MVHLATHHGDLCHVIWLSEDLIWLVPNLFANSTAHASSPKGFRMSHKLIHSESENTMKYSRARLHNIIQIHNNVLGQTVFVLKKT